MRTVTSVAIILAVAYGIAALGMAALQRRFIYRPDTEEPSREIAGAQDAQIVRFAAADGTSLFGWFWPAQSGRATVLYLHGNAGHIGHRTGKLRPLVDAGYGLLLVEYRGYGGQTGRPTETGLYADGQGALDWLQNRLGGTEDIVLYGESLGTGVASWLAVHQAVAGVILEAPFTSIADIAQAQYPILPAQWLVTDRFDNLARIADIDAPVLILHGEADGLIPPDHGRTLAEEGPTSRLVTFPEGGHSDLFEHGAWPVVAEWLSFVRG